MLIHQTIMKKTKELHQLNQANANLRAAQHYLQRAQAPVKQAAAPANPAPQLLAAPKASVKPSEKPEEKKSLQAAAPAPEAKKSVLSQQSALRAQPAKQVPDKKVGDIELTSYSIR